MTEDLADQIDRMKPGAVLWRFLAECVCDGRLTESEAQQIAAFWGGYVRAILKC